MLSWLILRNLILLNSIVASPTVLGKNDGSKTVAIIRTPTLEIWATFTIICAFFIGLALFSLLGTVVVYRRRHKKQLQRLQQRRQHQLLRKCPNN